MSKTKIKICGITNLEDAEYALLAGADCLGFNFYKASPRYVDPEKAASIVRKIGQRAWLVGVFVNHARKEVEEIALEVGLNTLQFHGDEDLDFCRNWPLYRVMKAIRVKEGEASYQNFVHAVDHLLIDKFSESQFGGTGEQVHDDLLKELSQLGVLRQAFLAGGITPENGEEKVRAFSPFGIDVASGVEERPGKKSASKISRLIETVRKLD